MTKSIDKEIEIVVDNENMKFTFESHVRGFHFYQTVWSPIIGNEDLEYRHEKKKMKEMSLQLVLPLWFLWFAERNSGRTYSTEYIQIRIQALAASRFETLMQSNKKYIE